MRYRITLSYDGSSFCGWQIQNDAMTVQECLQNALSTLLKEDIAVTGAGRTDSKVNAINYVAHFEASDPGIDASAVGYKINAIYPPESRYIRSRFAIQSSTPDSTPHSVSTSTLSTAAGTRLCGNIPTSTHSLWTLRR